jgi:SAM-dependent methyltransferase
MNDRDYLHSPVKLEKMSDFFEARVEGYEARMLNDIKGIKEGYRKLAELIPEKTKAILDLGCGTGLELDEIFKRFLPVSVVGIDLTPAMLDKLKQKHPHFGLLFVPSLRKRIFCNPVKSRQTKSGFGMPSGIGLLLRLTQSTGMPDNFAPATSLLSESPIWSTSLEFSPSNDKALLNISLLGLYERQSSLVTT